MTPLIGTFSAGTARGFRTTVAVAAPGQQLYDTVGSYTFTAPAGVTSVSVCCIGAGANTIGGLTQVGGQDGGGGGALAYANNISVTPGANYTVVVGAGTSGANRVSSFNTNSCRVNGGNGSTGGTVVNGTGGSGGNGGAANQGYSGEGGRTVLYGGGGGGGAGGYSGAGGNGGANNSNGTTTNGGNGSAGSGGGAGGGGGGAGYNYYINSEFYYYGILTGRPGGGTGIKGTGANGPGGTGAPMNGEANSGYGGSDGETNISNNTGGAYGGGAPSTGAYYTWDPINDSGGAEVKVGGGNINGSKGAVRIIWGTGRSYPSTAADV